MIFSKWKKQCYQEIPNNRIYTYIGECCKTIANKDIDRIGLLIVDDKIEMIYIEIYCRNQECLSYSTLKGIWDEIVRYFSIYLGDYEKIFREEKIGYVNSTGWCGNEICLNCSYIWSGTGNKKNRVEISYFRIPKNVKGDF